MQGGDLDSRLQAIKAAGTHVAPRQVLDWLVQLSMALQYIHELCVVPCV